MWMSPRGCIETMSPVLNQPSSVQRSACFGRVVVRGRDPRAADLELAHRLVVPGDLVALGVARTELDQRQRQPLERDVVELGLVVRFGEVAGQRRLGGDRRGLGHPPAVDDRQAVALR